MAKEFGSIVKITLPRLSRICSRKRLLRLLDAAKDRPVTWIMGPPGSGKTTLVADFLDKRRLPSLWYSIDEGDGDIATFFYYLGLAAKKASPRYRKPLPALTPEYLLGIPTFTQRFFEKLFERLKLPFAIVFDNYQNAPADSGLHDLVVRGLSIAPEGVRVFIVSRNEPLPPFARIRANGAMHLVGWDELRFTLAEAKDLIRVRGKKTASRSGIEELHRKTNGWAAGLVLLTEGAQLPSSHDDRPMRTGEPKEVFDYFAGEIFERLDIGTRDFLLVTSFLPTVTVRAARELTGQDNAAQILSKVNRNHFFTEKHQSPNLTYQYHPLFRDFLLSRMKESLKAEGLVRIEKKAARLLEEEGFIEEAASIYSDAQDWEKLIPLILGHAQALMMQGRSKTLEERLARIPKEISDSTPWLLYWKGMSCFTRNPAESSIYLKQAFQKFRSQQDVPGVFLAWSGTVDSVLYSFEEMTRLDEWIELYDDLTRDSALLSPEIESRAAACMLMALTFRQPWRTDLHELLNKALLHADVNMKIQALFYYVFHMTHVDNLAGIQPDVDTLHHLASSRDTLPFHRITAYLIETIYYNLKGEYQLSRAAAFQGLKISDESGVHPFDFMTAINGYISAYNYGDHVAAHEFISRMPPDPSALQPYDRSLYDHIQALNSFLDGNLDRASIFNDKALRLSLKSGDPISPFVTGILHALIMHERGEREKAKEFLEQMIEPWRRDTRSHDTFLYYLTKAYLFLDDADQTAALDFLKKALAIGKEAQCVSTHVLWRPAIIGRLYCTALEHGIEVEYVKQLIRKRNFTPDEPPIHIENWPWPIKIYTLGRFEIEKDGKMLHFPGKVQKKPLELLKALIAFGGTDVPEGRLIDALWPDADGDLAHKSVENNVARLRRLLGNDRAIILRDGRLSVDSRFCWTDVAMFERLIQNAEAVSNEGGGFKGKSAIPPGRLEKAVALYRGDFLAGEDGLAWAVTRRETVKNRCLRALILLARHYYGEDEVEKAIEYCRKGLEFDALAEEFYRDLMLCYKKLGRESEAVRVYHRCKDELAGGLGIEPSSATVEIYRQLTAQNNNPRTQ